MGEIRSTLDIIMEKTKGLTMTEEEKSELKREEMSRKVSVLVQKHLDGILDLDRFKAETTAAGVGQAGMLQGTLKEELMRRIEPGKDNETLLRLLGHTTLVDVPRVRQILDDFERRLNNKKAVCETTLRSTLKNRGISGSAVVPNILKDDEWLHYMKGINKEFHKALVG